MKKDNIYIGMRYVPRFMGVFNPDSEYEPLSLVKSEEDSSVIYISIIPAPTGTSLTDTTYWQSYTASADTSGLEAELAALTTKVNANEGAITGLTSTVDGNTANISQNASSISQHTATLNTHTGEISTLKSSVQTTSNRIDSLSTQVEQLTPIKPIEWHLSTSEGASKYIDYIPNPSSMTSQIRGENAYYAYPSLFDAFPYINEISWFDLNNNQEAITHSSQQVSKSVPSIQFSLINMQPTGGYFQFLLNPTSTAESGQNARYLIIPQRPTVKYPLLPNLQIHGTNAVYINAIPALRNFSSSIQLQMRGLKSWMQPHVRNEIPKNVRLVYGRLGDTVLLQYTDAPQNFNVTPDNNYGIYDAAIQWDGLSGTVNRLGLPTCPGI